MSEQYAFPGYLHTRKPDGEMHAESFPGLTKRELFAAMAMQGILSSWPDDESFADMTRLAVAFADDLLANLNGDEQ